MNVLPEPLGVFDCCSKDRDSYRIQVVRQARQPEPRCLERYAAASGSRIENRYLFEGPQHRRQPLLVVSIRAVAERAIVVVRIVDAIPSTERLIDDSSGGHRIAANPDHSHKPLPVRVRWEQGCEHGRARGHQRPPCPPDMKAVWSGEGSHGSALPQALYSQRCNRQPALDQAGVRHVFVSKKFGRWLVISEQGK